MLTYQVMRKHPTSFRLLTGLSFEEFEVLAEKVRPEWEKSEKAKEVSGRPHGVGGLKDHIFVMLIYYRVYITQAFIGVLYGVNDSTISRCIRRIEKMVVKVIKINKVRTVSQAELETIIVDCTEQPIERPVKNQKKFYSGKKKKHTIKTEIVIQHKPGKKARIISVSKAHPGKTHDYKIRKAEKPFHRDVRVFMDLGYLGLQKEHMATEIPFKQSKNRKLTREEKEYNTALSRIRVTVEHTLARIKNFKIMAERYRNRRKQHNLRFNVIAGILNFQAGY